MRNYKKYRPTILTLFSNFLAEKIEKKEMEIAEEIEEREKEWLSDITRLSDQEMDAKWEQKGVLKEQEQSQVKPPGLTGMPAIMMALKHIEKQPASKSLQNQNTETKQEFKNLKWISKIQNK
jgi:hypothetical protein